MSAATDRVNCSFGSSIDVFSDGLVSSHDFQIGFHAGDVVFQLRQRRNQLVPAAWGKLRSGKQLGRLLGEPVEAVEHVRQFDHRGIDQVEGVEHVIEHQPARVRHESLQRSCRQIQFRRQVGLRAWIRRACPELLPRLLERDEVLGRAECRSHLQIEIVEACDDELDGGELGGGLGGGGSRRPRPARLRHERAQPPQRDQIGETVPLFLSGGDRLVPVHEKEAHRRNLGHAEQREGREQLLPDVQIPHHWFSVTGSP